MAKTYPTSRLSKDYILAHTKWCAPKFLHALENDQVLLTHPLAETEVFCTFFYNTGLKIGLKFRECAPIALRVVSVTS